MTRKRKIWLVAVSVLLVVVAVPIIWFAISLNRLVLPPPSGPYAVGRARLSLVDDARAERFNPRSRREVIAEVWYPAAHGSGEPSAYFPELAALSGALIESSQLSSLEAWGVRRVQAHARSKAAFASAAAPSRVVILSPGNGTNVEFYSAIGEDLASHGYVVFGVNHPYDVGAVRLRDGSIASYRERPFGDSEALRLRMVERSADVGFLLDRLSEINTGNEAANESGDVIAGRLDLSKVGVIGHSLGGMTAAEFCSGDPRPSAGVNLDGLHASNPYGASPDAQAPPQPFLYLGKERTIGPKTRELIEGAPRARLVSVPGASHQSFSDAGLFEPTLLSWDGSARDILEFSRRQLVDFLDQHL